MLPVKAVIFGVLLAGTASATFAQPAFDAATAKTSVDKVLSRTYPGLETLYKDIHSHPEVAFQEVRTGALLAQRMRKLGFEVTEHVGKTGIVAVYRNGPGPVVMVRTELDALPMEEKTGLPYASRAQQTVDGKVTFVDHACGHDMHMAWWVGTAEALLALKDRWHGTLLFVGQPAEETVSGAKAMLEDGLFTRFPKPDFGFAAHVSPEAAGVLRVKQGVLSSASDALAVRFHGVGAHGSMPDKSIDPVVQGARFVMDVQSVISRQKDPHKFGVITVGAFNAGTVGNIIPDRADLLLSLRSFDADTRKLLNEGVVTTAKAIADMSHAPAPEVSYLSGTASVVNDDAMAAALANEFRTAFGEDTVKFQPAYEPGGAASEDYSEFVAAGVPKSVFFGVGGLDPKLIADARASGKSPPVNHSPFFAPVPEPTIRTGVAALTLAVLSVATK